MGHGLDDCYEILRMSGKELMCEPYSIRDGESISVISPPRILSKQVSQVVVDQQKHHPIRIGGRLAATATNINFITPMM